MVQATHRELLPGVQLTAVHTNKFKTCVIGVHLLAPLDEATASLNALLPQVLRRGTRRHPDMESLSAALDELYGGSVEPMVRKKGETQCIGFMGSFLDDVYTPDGAMILESAAALMGDLLLRPALENGGFRPDYVAGERANLADRIRAQMNNKRQYSVLRTARIMCEEEPYGVDALGDEARASAITGEALWERYHTLLTTAPVAIYYCGSAPVARVEEALKRALDGLPRTGPRSLPPCTARPDPFHQPPLFVEERLDVAQGKLAMGFRTGGASAAREDLPALLVCNAVFGGTTTSKLFMNVRERLSLCYFASSMVERYKGIMLVSSGIEFDKFAQTRDEILAQLEACRAGQIEESEMEAARRSLISSLHSTLDAHGRLEDYWLGHAAAGLTEGPEALARRVEPVTKEQVARAARGIALDTVYFLRGKGA
ncbi:MAG: insulinase family protein [Clostridiales bacterium]|nr:insulinase family protein [Clostridiales bacterium]